VSLSLSWKGIALQQRLRFRQRQRGPELRLFAQRRFADRFEQRRLPPLQNWRTVQSSIYQTGEQVAHLLPRY
jgi:hypothetical protein